jgi:hypothetical protein
MEYIATVIYTVAGARIPLQKDYHLNVDGSPEEQHALHGGTTGYHVPAAYHTRGQSTYVPSASYAPQTAYDPEYQTPYRTQENIAYTPPPAPKFSPKE